MQVTRRTLLPMLAVLGAAASAQARISVVPVRTTVERGIVQMRHCYERERQRTPSLRGRVVLRLVIQGNGAVREATVQQAPPELVAVGQCMANVARSWHFPWTNAREIAVNYPFYLDPSP